MSAVPSPAPHAASNTADDLLRTFRRGLWLLGAPARLLLIGLVRLYRVSLSGWLGTQCRYHPTCSHYAEEAIRAVGAVRGSALAAWRVARCGPFGAGGFDPPPTRDRGHSLRYEAVIHSQGGGTP